jgi:glycosyltransferase involved in cell wall biosynthesis
MRILYITQAGLDEPGAETTHATEVIRNFVKRGFDVKVIHPGKSLCVRALGASECAAPPVNRGILSRARFQLWLLFRFWRRRTNADVIYVRQAALMIVPALLRRWHRTPIVAEFNTLFARRENAGRIPLLLPLLKTIERRALKEYDRVVVVSAPLKDAILHNYTIAQRRIAIVHNGTNLDLMRPLPRDACREALNLPRNAFVIAFVGTLHPWQGISPLITAVAELHPSKSGEVHLLIAGTSPDQAKYEAEAALRGLGRRAHFLGAIEYERVPEIISAADVSVAPGDPTQSIDYRIRSPLKIYEYLACGRPVIAGELDSIRGLFANNHVGFLVKPGSIRELVAAIDRLRDDPELAARMSENARSLAERSLSWDAATEQLVTILRSAAT